MYSLELSGENSRPYWKSPYVESEKGLETEPFNELKSNSSILFEKIVSANFVPSGDAFS